jgi:hypothetical protein
VVAKLHRIEPKVVKADFARAGFELEAESNLLRVPRDDRSLSVFDKVVRGKPTGSLCASASPFKAPAVWQSPANLQNA